MDTETLRSTLEDVGLTQYEAEAYITVLELGSASATEIANASGVPQARIYDVLRNLEGSGYVETYEEDSLRARARDPAEIIEKLDAYAETVADAGSELEDRWEEPTVENHQVSVIRPADSVFDRAAEKIEDAKNEIQTALTPDQYQTLKSALVSAHDRGVVIKATITGVEEPPDFDFEGVVTEVRHRRLPTPFLVLVDRLSACFTPAESVHPAQRYGLLINDYSLSHMVDWYFQTAFWEPWPTIYSGRETGTPRVYTNIRECIRDIYTAFDTGKKIILTVHGQLQTEGVEKRLTGTVVDITYTPGENGPALATFTEEASIEMETAEGTFNIGGWGAMLEDIEGRRFVVESIA
ncbi:TrmB family transcriptional regulator [Halomicroarcula sp. GCM10025709]|uniref:TrmB family transcriptional regulator n=1 Tax=Haloarcula TaxID=2237 RepID=UPI0024C374AD|nr:TrmB family transcriptional regulator sugar-binding domain-containing protein [Halomicroarcula sp. YJ-61-S]